MQLEDYFGPSGPGLRGQSQGEAGFGPVDGTREGELTSSHSSYGEAVSGIHQSVSSKHEQHASPFAEARKSYHVQEAKTSIAPSTRKQAYSFGTKGSEARPKSRKDLISGINKAPLKVKKQRSHAVQHLPSANASEVAMLDMPPRRSDVGQLPSDDKAKVKTSQTHRFVAEAGTPLLEKGLTLMAARRTETKQQESLHILAMVQEEKLVKQGKQRESAPAKQAAWPTAGLSGTGKSKVAAATPSSRPASASY